MARNDGMPFREWWDSKHNPLHDASGIAKDFAKDAVRDAFEAGRMYQLRLRLDAMKARREASKDNFSFDDSGMMDLP